MDLNTKYKIIGISILLITIFTIIIYLCVTYRQNFTNVYKLPVLGNPRNSLQKMTVPLSYDEPSSDEPSSDEPSSDEPSSDEPSSDEPQRTQLLNLYKYKTKNLEFPKMKLVTPNNYVPTKIKEKSIQHIMNDLSNPVMV
jgi:hypothetical protein